MKARGVLTVAVIFALVIGMLMTQVGTVSAKRPVETTFTNSFVDISIELEELPSGAIRITYSVVLSATGDWVGDWEVSGVAILSPSGAYSHYLILTFTGTILGKEGTLKTRSTLHGSWPGFPDVGTLEPRVSKLTILGGTGDLSNVHGHGIEEEPLTWRVWISFGP